MGASVASVQALPEYRLRVCFCNGSEAIVNMERRIQAIRFHKLADPGLFETAQAQGDLEAGRRVDPCDDQRTAGFHDVVRKGLEGGTQ